MALIVVNLTDTFNDWREKTNLQIEQVGDLSALATQNSSSIVSAINGMLDEVEDDATPKLGGPLDVNGKSIISAANGNITITPNGSGKVIITKGNFTGELGAVTFSADLALGGNDITGTGNLGTVGTPIVGNAQITGNAVLSGTVTATTFLGDLNGTINTATTAATQLQSDNSTKLATTAWAKTYAETYADAAVALENTLEEMNDTTIAATPTNLDVLQYDSSGGGSWKNRSMTAAGVPSSGFTVAMAIALG